MSSEAVDYDAQVEAVREAFEREFGRFARFRAFEGTEGLALDEAEALSREAKELATRHTAKKSAVSQLMKLVGRVPAEERARCSAARRSARSAGFRKSRPPSTSSASRSTSPR